MDSPIRAHAISLSMASLLLIGAALLLLLSSAGAAVATAAPSSQVTPGLPVGHAASAAAPVAVSPIYASKYLDAKYSDLFRSYSGSHLTQEDLAHLESTHAQLPAPGPSISFGTPYLVNVTGRFAASAMPPIQVFGGAVYDPVDGYTLYVGGLYINAHHTAYVDDFTWTFSGSTWTNLTSTAGTPPPSTAYPTLVWDAADKMVLYFSGEPFSGTSHALFWGFSGGKWTNLTSGYPDILYPEATYDGGLGKVVVLGGFFEPSNRINWGTYTYVGGTWTNLTSLWLATPFHFFGAFAYDAIDGYDVLYGGQSSTSAADSSTWIFSNMHWINITGLQSDNLPGETFMDLTYAPQLGELLLTGGSTEAGLNSQIFAFSGGQWSSYYYIGPTPITWAAQISWDSLNDGLVISGGFSYITGFPASQIFISSPGIWIYSSNLPGDTEVGHPETFYVQVLGGWGTLSYSWTGLPPGCASTSWSFVCDPTAPTSGIVTGEILVTDTNLMTNWYNFGGQTYPEPLVYVSGPTTGEVGEWVTYTGSITGGLTPYEGCDWYWNGNEINGAYNCTTASLQLTSTGWGNVSVKVWDAYGWGTWSAPLEVDTVSALAVSITASATSLDLGHSITLTPESIGGAPLSTCDWWVDGSVTVANNCAPLSWTTDQAGTYAVQVQAWDSNGVSATSPTMELTVNPDPWITSFGAVNAWIDLGEWMTLNTGVAGGTAPYNIAYSGLPTGCSGVGPQLTCDPSAAGTASITVTVSDSAGATATAATTVWVEPVPTVSLSSSAASVAAGNLVTFSSVASGGVSPWTYAWSGLPAGCAPSSGPTVSCSPTTGGTYTVWVWVTDHNGVQASASTTLTVTGSTSSSSSGSSSSLSPGFLGLPGAEGGLLIGILVILAIMMLLLLVGAARGGMGGGRSPPAKAAAPAPAPAPASASWSEASEPAAEPAAPAAPAPPAPPPK